MEEQYELSRLGITGEWIWGDDAETAVYAQAFGMSKILIFRFSHDEHSLDSIASKIVSCYHNLQRSGSQNLPDRPTMRKALWEVVASTWVDCAELVAADAPGTIFEVTDKNRCKIAGDSLFTNYLSILPSLEAFTIYRPRIEAIAFEDLTRLQQLGGRGSTTLVHPRDKPEKRSVYKGIDFRTYLYGFESGAVEEEVKVMKRSWELLESMPGHPNILTAPYALVTLVNPATNDRVVCGSLYPFYPKGTLAEQIEKSNSAGTRIPLELKARWCRQMTDALLHTHYVAKTYHRDIKPGNFLLSDDQDLILIDWEQTDAPVSTVAPELDGTWDAEEIHNDGESAAFNVQYTKYKGPERRNMPESTPGDHGWNVWNSLLEWQRTCPRAAELAEVFSLGRTMWMLLRQYNHQDLEGIENTEDITEDWDASNDIPLDWRKLVDQCLERDPRRRPTLKAIHKFWNAYKIRLQEK